MKYIIDQRAFDEIRKRHPWFWHDHVATPVYAGAKTCDKCKHKDGKVTDEPCYSCFSFEEFSNFEPKDVSE